jgi:hypothetical protein
MQRSFSTAIPLLCLQVALCSACAVEGNEGDATTKDESALRRVSWGDFPRWFSPAPHGSTFASPGGAPTTDPTAPPDAVPPEASSSDGSGAIIAAAQTPDGRAIPQAAGPNGACPPVVAVLGFWACPTLDETCSFAANGATHDCVCARVDGEGQSASWACH